MNLQKDNWEKVKLGTVCDFKNGFNYNKGDLSNGVKVIGVIDFQDYFIPKFENLSLLVSDRLPSKDFLIKPNDILFVRSNGNKELVGRALFIDQVPFPTTFSAFCIRARFEDKNFNPKFYAYFFRSPYFKSKLLGIAQGTNINNLSQNLLSQVEISRPSLEEQEKITDLFQSIDDSIEQAEEQEKNLRALAKRLIDGLINEQPTFGDLLKVKELAKVKFADVADCIDRHERQPLDLGLTRFVGLENIEPENFRISTWGNIADGTTFTKTFASGDVLFGKRRSYLKKVAIAEFDGICSSDILVFRAKENKILADLLPFYAASESFIQYAVNTSAGSLSPRTKWRDLAKFELSIPDLETQSKILEVLQQIQTTIEQTIEQKETLKNLKFKLLNEILG